MAIALATAGLILGACGRKGDPEPPPSQTITREDGTRVEKPKGPDRPFILDGLLD